MEIAELLRNSIITCIEAHVSCLIIIFLLFRRMYISFRRSGKKLERSLTLVYVGCALMLVSDCIWTCISSLGHPGNAVSYIINLIYFIGSSFAAASWGVFCTKHLGTESAANKYWRVGIMILYDFILILYLLSPWFGFIFSIQGGEYVRGSLFFLDPVIKMGFVGFSCIYAIIYGCRRDVDYLRKRDFHYAGFGIPVIICGILQTITGVDFNSVGVTFGLILIYAFGISNQDRENVNAIYALSNAFEASYIVNMDTGKIRALHEDKLHSKETAGMSSDDFSTHFKGVLSDILLPEDKRATLEMCEIENVAKRFELDNSFSIRYRIKENSGQTSIHTATYIRAIGDKGKQEFLLGINTINSDSLVYERNEMLRSENQRLEHINTSIIESVAKIVEVRDGGSGEHIVRVRKFTEIIAKEVMLSYPQFNLDEEGVKLISSASVLHDVGKIVIPDAVLLKPGRLTDDEFEIMKTHSAKGCDILNIFPLGLDDAFLECALSICRWHHEKYDGKGYPDGLKGDEIPISAQIVSAADCFDALVSERPYKEAFSPEKAFEMIVGGECGAFSPEIIGALEKQKGKLMELARLFR